MKKDELGLVICTYVGSLQNLIKLIWCYTGFLHFSFLLSFKEKKVLDQHDLEQANRKYNYWISHFLP